MIVVAVPAVATGGATAGNQQSSEDSASNSAKELKNKNMAWADMQKSAGSQ